MKSFKKLNVTLVYNLRKKIKELKQSEEKFKIIFDEDRDGILVADAKTRKFLSANPAMIKMLGYTEKELLQLDVSKIHPKKDLHYVIEQFTKQLKGEIEVAENLPMLRKDKSIFYADINAVPMRIGKQDVLTGFFKDVTERKKAEEKLRESEEKYKAIVENATDQIFMLDTKLRFISINTKAANMSHHTPEEMIGTSILDLFPKETAARFAKNNKEVIETGKSKFIEEKMVVNGKEFYNNTVLNPVKDSKGDVVAVMGIVRDVTEKERAEEKIKESEELLHAMFNGISDGLLVADVQNRKFVYANLQIRKITGYAEKELLRLSVKDLHFKKDLPYILKQFKRMAKGEISVVRDIPVARKDKTIVHCDISSRIIDVNGRKCMAGIFRDVTKIAKKERKNHQK
jgi:PAS domain S-box-containing protein